MKLFKCALAVLASAGMLTACSSDEPAVVANGDGNVTFTVSLPANAQSRAVSDGFKANSLWVVAYDQTTGRHVDNFDAQFTPGNLSTTVSLQLMNGRSYNVVFWACNSYNSSKDPATLNNGVSSAPYYFDVTNGTITVNYDALKVNDDYMDAFFNSTTIAVAANRVDFDITLRRPFAQLNIGTDDLKSTAVINEFDTYTKDANGVLTWNANNKLNTYVTLEVPTVLDMVSRRVDNASLKTVTLPVSRPCSVMDYTYANSTWTPVANAPFPCQDPTKPGWTGYPQANPLNPTEQLSLQYLFMDYLLADTLGATSNVKIEFANGTTVIPDATLEIPNVPLQYNYMTNIYGSLLTTKVNYHVTKNPIYDGYHNIAVWDGTAIAPTDNAFDVQNRIIHIYTPEALAYVRNFVNGTTSGQRPTALNNVGASLDGWTIILENNLDLRNIPFVKFGLPAPANNQFAGTFNFNGKYIYSCSNTPDPWYLFANLSSTAKVVNGNDALGALVTYNGAVADQAMIRN